jgi:hypothetical protein
MTEFGPSKHKIHAYSGEEPGNVPCRLLEEEPGNGARDCVGYLVTPCQLPKQKALHFFNTKN